MEMMKVAMLGVCAVLIALQMKHANSGYELWIILASALCIFFFVIKQLDVVIDAVHRLQDYIDMDQRYLGILLKMIGITYIAEFSGNLCKDAGYHALASQIEMFGKISILVISMPVLLALLDMIHQFLA